MAKALSDESIADIRRLVSLVTQSESDSSKWNQLEKNAISRIKRGDSMYFLNTKDIDREVNSMADKFSFHGFARHAEYLKLLANSYIDRNLSESDLTPRLNVVKFLLCMSESPTTRFWKHPQEFEFIKAVREEEHVVDWAAYLNEGLDTWLPGTKDSSDSSSDSEDSAASDRVDAKNPMKRLIEQREEVRSVDHVKSRMELVESVQSSGMIQPQSGDFQANVAVLWENYLAKESYGLVELDSIAVISEYKVMREILWQLWGPHTSTVFELDRNRIVCRKNVTVSSVRLEPFCDFMARFLSYIEILEEFRQFELFLASKCDNENVPVTYRCYAQSLQRIITPFYGQLVALEDEIREQETSMTLLKLISKLEMIFKPLKILKEIQAEVIEDISKNTALNSVLNLLVKQRKNLEFTLDKMDQDVRLTVYIESLYHYLNIIDTWLIKNDLSDYTNEFVITSSKSNDAEQMAWQMSFHLRKLDENLPKDGFIEIICDQVLEIGRNINFLRLLGKYDVFRQGKETIYEEFVRRILEKLCLYYDYRDTDIFEKTENKEELIKTEDNPSDWHNYVDLSDGFLLMAFENFDSKKKIPIRTLSLYEKISKVTKNLFPLQRLPENILAQILEDRFTISGLLVKNLLVENYHLIRQLDFLNHIFLFSEDLIFPFYIRLFDKMNMPNSNWGNSVWLTSHFQDVIMDAYPNFYENCTVQVKEYWKDCCDSIEALALLQLNYAIKWPMNMIITGSHMALYREMFEFVLKIKWALYVLNRLLFADLEAKINISTSKKLKYLRFALINLFNSLQHHVFGSILARALIKLKNDLDKANDFRSLMLAHENFVQETHRQIVRISSEKHNDIETFLTLLKCVKMLKIMWNKREYAKYENLEKCYKMYKITLEQINPHINPVIVFD